MDSKKTNQPPSRPVLVAAFIGTALIAYIAGVVTVNHSRPDTWEACFVSNMAEAHTKLSAEVLVRHCRNQRKNQQQP